MGQCFSGNFPVSEDRHGVSVTASPMPAPSPVAHSTPTNGTPLPAGLAPSPSPVATPRRRSRWPFPPPSPSRPIMSGILRRRNTPPATPTHGPRQERPETSEEGSSRGNGESRLDKNFGYLRNFYALYELGRGVGKGHFGHTCSARVRRGEQRNQQVAVKILSKARMTTALAIEDVRREVTILRTLSGHPNLVRFYEAFEDDANVYIVMEFCQGGELLERVLARGDGGFPEEEAKKILIEILNVVSFCHLQGVVHRDLKPENFLFTSRNEDAIMKVIDFGLSDFIRPDQKLNDIVGSAFYVAPEVLHRSYNVEADMWSVGVIAYILLCGNRPFWAATESGIFRSVLRADPNFDNAHWTSISSEGRDFVKRLLIKDHRKRMTAVQALTHPWLMREDRETPLDIFMFKRVKSYIRSTSLKRAALMALSRALTGDELVYIRAQFKLLNPTRGAVSLSNFREALLMNATDAMRESRVLEILNMMEHLANARMEFDEFCAACISPHQLEALERWDEIVSEAYEYFEIEGNRVISVEDLAMEMNLGPTAHSLLQNWIRRSDSKLSYVGFTKFLHGVTIRTSTPRNR